MFTSAARSAVDASTREPSGVVAEETGAVADEALADSPFPEEEGGACFVSDVFDDAGAVDPSFPDPIGVDEDVREAVGRASRATRLLGTKASETLGVVRTKKSHPDTLARITTMPNRVVMRLTP